MDGGHERRVTFCTLHCKALHVKENLSVISGAVDAATLPGCRLVIRCQKLRAFFENCAEACPLKEISEPQSEAGALGGRDYNRTEPNSRDVDRRIHRGHPDWRCILALR
jgi:hypothetical protein